MAPFTVLGLVRYSGGGGYDLGHSSLRWKQGTSLVAAPQVWFKLSISRWIADGEVVNLAKQWTLHIEG